MSQPRAGIVPFVAVVSAILLAATWFACATWSHFSKTSADGWIIPFVLTLTFIVTTIFAMRFSNPTLRWAYRISALWLGVLNYAFFEACAAWMLVPFHLEPRWIAALCFGGAIFISIYGLWNASWLRVSRVTVKLANLPPAWRGCDLALVTDLHLGNVRGASFSRRVVDRLKKLKPQAILISGDLYDGTSADFDALIEPWRTISPPSGIYFVTGNHEEFTDRTKYLRAVERAGLRVLNNEKVESEGLQIVGIHDGETQVATIFRERLQQAGLDPGRPSILLAHRPSNLGVAEEAGVSLQVSGHTHGGQFWPWTWVARRVHRQFNHGLNRHGQIQVLTSYGIGTWGAPMRVGTKSEIVLLRLESANL